VSRYLGASRGFLVAVDLPPGPAWLDVTRLLWDEGVAFLPIDPRLSGRERHAIVDLAEPACVISADGETLFADPAPIDGGVSLVVATSGTAGRPRLVELARSAITASARLSLAALGATFGRMAIDPAEAWVCCLSPAHIGGMLVLLRRLVFATPVTVLERFDPSTLTDRAPAGAHVSLVPTMLGRLIDAGVDLSRFGALLVGGASLDPEVEDRARSLGGRVVTTYGLTETCGGVAYDGRLFDATEARIAGEGEIELRGPTVMEGYRHDPSATARAFSLDGWLRTGDAGAGDADGQLTVYGRLDEAIRTGAETVWPQEVEVALRGHRRVADVAVAGRPDPEWGEQVVAFVVPKRSAEPPSLDELRDHASARIARFKAPKSLVIVAELPRTASGKVRRSALPR
jgi:O-succinylbenzoic acid--CoA ligase